MIHPLARKHLAKVQAYSSAQSEFSSRDTVLLNANENALGSMFCRYPHSYPVHLQKKYVQFLQSKLKKEDDLTNTHLDPENIMFFNGSDEAIDLIIRAFCEPKEDSILVTSPSFTMYENWAKANNVNIIDVPLQGENLNILDTVSILSQRAKVIFLCSPNNPIGSSLSFEQIEEIVEKTEGKSLVVVDEAYIEFSRKKSALSLLEKYPHVIILRTFSKAWGLAGVRAGLMIADTSILDVITRIKAPYNFTAPAQKAVEFALDNFQDMRMKVGLINVEKKRVQEFLESLSSVKKIYESDANFLLVEWEDAQKIYETLLASGIVVRDRSMQVANTLRITIGTREENDMLMKVLEKIKY